MKPDPYHILGVAQDATSEELRSAYRRRAHELHPDHHGPDGEPFLRLQDAYRLLSDQQRRTEYDRRRERSRRRAEPMTAPRPAEAFTLEAKPPPEAALWRSFATYGPSFDELFDRFWSNYSTVSRPKAERIEGLTVEIILSPEEARQGGELRLMVPAMRRCPACGGEGRVARYECWRCSGHGSLTADYPVRVAYPSGILDEYRLQIPLAQYGIANFFLSVRFRVSAEGGLN